MARLNIKLTVIKTGMERNRLVAEYDYTTMIALTEMMSVKDGFLVLRSKQWAKLDEYRRAGFAVPVKIPLSDFS